MVNPNSFLLPLTQITWIPQVRGAVVDVLESLTGVVQGCAVSTVHQVVRKFARAGTVARFLFSSGFWMAATNTCFSGSSP